MLHFRIHIQLLVQRVAEEPEQQNDQEPDWVVQQCDCLIPAQEADGCQGPQGRRPVACCLYIDRQRA